MGKGKISFFGKVSEIEHAQAVDFIAFQFLLYVKQPHRHSTIKQIKRWELLKPT